MADTRRNPRRATIAWIVALGLVLWAVDAIYRALKVDECLDRGGAWNATTKECNGSPQHV